MEAANAIVKNNLRNPTTAIIVGAILGLLLGLLIGWVIWPVQVTDATPEILRTDLQEDWLRMAIDSFTLKPNDLDSAVRRWNDLGEAAAPLSHLIRWASPL
jgi:hypothetical protein